MTENCGWHPVSELPETHPTREIFRESHFLLLKDDRGYVMIGKCWVNPDESVDWVVPERVVNGSIKYWSGQDDWNANFDRTSKVSE